MSLQIFKQDTAFLTDNITNVDNLQLCDWLNNSHHRTARLRLVINSGGGELDFEVVKAMMLANVHTHALMEAQGAAAIYFFAGAPRTCSEKSVLVFHTPQIEYLAHDQSPEKDLSLRMEYYKIINFLSRIGVGRMRDELVDFFIRPKQYEKARRLPIDLLWSDWVIDGIGNPTGEYLGLTGRELEAYETLVETKL